MSPLLLMAETLQRPGIDDMLEKFGVNLYDLISQAVCFLILAYVLNRFVFKPVMNIVEKRRKEAEEAAVNAENIRKMLKETEESRAEVIREAHFQAEKLIISIKADAERLRHDEVVRTEKLASMILEKAREEALMKQNKLKLELKNELAEIIVSLTGAIASKELNKDDKERLVDIALTEINSEISKQTGKGG